MKHSYQRPMPQSKPKTDDDLFLDELRDTCARAMAGHLKSLDTNRPIKSLTLPEMLGLAEACTARWIVAVSKRMAEDRSKVPVRVQNLLMG